MSWLPPSSVSFPITPAHPTSWQPGAVSNSRPHRLQAPPPSERKQSPFPQSWWREGWPGSSAPPSAGGPLLPPPAQQPPSFPGTDTLGCPRHPAKPLPCARPEPHTVQSGSPTVAAPRAWAHPVGGPLALGAWRGREGRRKEQGGCPGPAARAQMASTQSRPHSPGGPGNRRPIVGGRARPVAGAGLADSRRQRRLREFTGQVG